MVEAIAVVVILLVVGIVCESASDGVLGCGWWRRHPKTESEVGDA